MDNDHLIDCASSILKKNLYTLDMIGSTIWPLLSILKERSLKIVVQQKVTIL